MFFDVGAGISKKISLTNWGKERRKKQELI